MKVNLVKIAEGVTVHQIFVKKIEKISDDQMGVVMESGEEGLYPLDQSVIDEIEKVKEDWQAELKRVDEEKKLQFENEKKAAREAALRRSSVQCGPNLRIDPSYVMYTKRKDGDLVIVTADHAEHLVKHNPNSLIDGTDTYEVEKQIYEAKAGL